MAEARKFATLAIRAIAATILEHAETADDAEERISVVLAMLLQAYYCLCIEVETQGGLNAANARKLALKLMLDALTRAEPGMMQMSEVKKERPH